MNFIVNLGASDDALIFTATIDPANAFTESNEGNNTASETTTVSGEHLHHGSSASTSWPRSSRLRRTR